MPLRHKNTDEIIRKASEHTDKTIRKLYGNFLSQNERERLDAFRRSEPLFYELFWNHDNRCAVSYVPEIYVRHLLQLRLEGNLAEDFDENQADRDTKRFFEDAVRVGYVEETYGHHAFREERGYKLTPAGSAHLTRKFQSTPWYIHLIKMIAASWRVVIIAFIAGSVAIFDFGKEVIPWFFNTAIPWLERFGH